MVQTLDSEAATEVIVDNPELRPNGMTEEQVRRALAAAGRRKNDPGYIERLFGDALDARRRINAEYLRELDAQETR